MRQRKKPELGIGGWELVCAVALAAGSAAHASPSITPESCPLNPGRGPISLAEPAATGPSPFAAAFEHLVSESPEPEKARSSLLLRVQAGMGCYPPNLTQQELEDLITKTQLLPPSLGPLGMQPRFYEDAYCWLGTAQIAPANTSRRASLTYSFPPDGTQWGLSCSSVGQIGPSTLDSSLISGFGSLDKGHEYMRQSIAAWRRIAGLTYQEVADNGEPMDNSVTHNNSRGDIRMGGFAVGTTGMPLAYDAFPSNLGFSTCAGGDMFINTSYFTSSYFLLTIPSALPYRFFRNTIAHEHGHGLGFKHTVPCDKTKLMEPVINTTVELLTSDEVRAAMTNYGDRYSGNHAFLTAQDFGSVTSPSLRSIYERDLGVNGPTVFVNGSPTAEDDYYRFTLGTAQTITITVTPTGVLLSQIQSDACNATPTTPINGQQAGHLQVQLLNSSQQVVASALTAAVGLPQTLTQALAAGTFTVRVWDKGDAPSASANQVVQTYDMLIRVGTAFSRPQVIAGVNKLGKANQPTYFMGNYNSRATDDGASIPSGNYDWDLDGDGVFETLANAQPSITYVSNGVYNVTLRVTDSNGMVGTDTITCTVTGATTTITSVTPASGLQGSTIPVTLNGTNLRQVTSLSQITVSNPGISLTGTPVPNTLGTQVNGVSFVIAANAPSSSCNVTISNADGTGTGVNVFTVGSLSAQGACCDSSGGCSTQTSTQCQSSGRTYLGDSTACSPNPCPQPGACCASSGVCTLVLPSTCTGTGGAFQAGACSPNPCPRPGACCASSGVCTLVLATTCTSSGGAFQAGVCSPNPCPQPGACCALDGSCTLVLQSACTASGTTFQSGVCSPNPCPQPGACCAGDGSCTFVVQSQCSAGFLPATMCSPNPCSLPSGACCLSNSSCTSTTSTNCAALGGVFKGVGVGCTLNLCLPATGACCAGSTCSMTTSTACTGVNRRFAGSGVACNASANMTTPCCRADFNQSSPTGTGGVTVQDIFAFLAAWFSQDPTADIDGSGTVTVQDIFVFLAAWFAKC